MVPQTAWEESFRNSAWFTRGWTLQELIASQSVEFFSSEGQLLALHLSRRKMKDLPQHSWYSTSYRHILRGIAPIPQDG
ncbi:hypothetical protein DM02DRAFT_620772 [Periconia macrospinosa]|uniref:Heterokaryon incompatibility domain-containing protein n=1 Tax=Periconia macrospinosa TaxID=97972 RepID=A0A2V1CYY1_9PLEO|nr:hypothetical protein DM02DRAFT_620772 [Periconia macrospinosa]